jgi:toxin ParE1/3/4
MTRRAIIRIEAEVDITDAAVWYEQQQSGLGYDFLAEVESAVARAAENPFHYPRLRRTPRCVAS